MSHNRSYLRTANVVIIGGGVIGLAIARALALRGVRDATAACWLNQLLNTWALISALAMKV